MYEITNKIRTNTNGIKKFLFQDRPTDIKVNSDTKANMSKLWSSLLTVHA